MCDLVLKTLHICQETIRKKSFRVLYYLVKCIVCMCVEFSIDSIIDQNSYGELPSLLFLFGKVWKKGIRNSFGKNNVGSTFLETSSGQRDEGKDSKILPQ